MLPLTITVTINYPSDLDELTRWSKRLFAVYYVCGLLGCACLLGCAWLVGGAVFGYASGPLWVVAVLVGLVLLFGAAMTGLEALVSEVDQRRYALVTARQHRHADQA